MADAAHYFGGDLTIGANGDLLLVSGDVETTQRIIRRLLTPQGGYIWNLTYGAGLPAQIGQPTNLIAVQNAIRAQIFNEPSVAKAPEPTVSLTNNNDGTFIANIAYTDAVTGLSQSLTVPVS